MAYGMAMDEGAGQTTALLATPPTSARAVAGQAAASGVAPPASRGAVAGQAAASGGAPPASGGAVAGQAAALLASVNEAVAALQGLPVWKLSESELLAVARDVEAAVRSVHGVQVRLAGETAQRRVDQVLSCRSAAHLLHETLNITIAQARGRITAARIGLPGESPTGAEIPPQLPELTEAVDAGTIGADHTAVIGRTMIKLPKTVDPGVRERCGQVLLDQATQGDSVRLARVADQILLIVDPDGTKPDDAPQRAEFSVGGRRTDGLTPVRGLLDDLTTETLRTAIEALAAPKPMDENTPDPRPAGLRRAQALYEIARRALAAGSGPADGGVRPQVVITIPLRDLTHRAGGGPTRSGEPGGEPTRNGGDARSTRSGEPGVGPTGPGEPGGGPTRSGEPGGGPTGPGEPGGGPTRPSREPTGPGEPLQNGGVVAGAAQTGSASASTGVAWFDYTGPVSPRVARLLACNAELIPQVLGTDSVVLDQGRATRLFDRHQRRAITTRDKGCAFPNCDIPANWCEAHHIAWWTRDLGETNRDNGVLLCSFHHHVIHQGAWVVRAITGGRPEFIPPAHIDPLQRPRRNTNWHLPERIHRRS